MLKFIGMIVVAGLVGGGVKWLLDNLTFKQQPEAYQYKTDADGNEIVVDSTDE